MDFSPTSPNENRINFTLSNELESGRLGRQFEHENFDRTSTYAVTFKLSLFMLKSFISCFSVSVLADTMPAKFEACSLLLLWYLYDDLLYT